MDVWTFYLAPDTSTEILKLSLPFINTNSNYPLDVGLKNTLLINQFHKLTPLDVKFKT